MTQLMIGWWGVETPQEMAASIDDAPGGIKISGRLSTNDPVTIKVLRAQLLGLAQQPTTPLPVVIDSAPHLNGWYVVDAASVDVGKGAMVLGYWPYSIELRRASRLLNPVLEARLVGALRTNSQSRTTCVGWYAIPSGSTIEGGPATITTPTTRATADGSVRVYSAGTNGLLDTSLAYRTDPEVAVVGGVKVRSGDLDGAPSTTFGATGAATTYTVPADVSRLRVVAWGAAGGGGVGGRGARVSCEVAVTPGETLNVRVGLKGTMGVGGFNGGGAGGNGGYGPTYKGYGGGGRTQLLRSTTNLIVAGGGGGQGSYLSPATPLLGGHGGAVGTAGDARFPGGASGAGGTAATGGTGGAGGGPAGSAGAAGTGGAGGALNTSDGLGGGGGGGGVYGGGGGGARSTGGSGRLAGSGGGGSSMGTGLSETIITGERADHGQLVITPITPELTVDRAIITGFDIESPFGWQLDNGLIRVTPVYRADAFMLDISCWNGSKWSPTRRWQLLDTNTMSAPAAMGPTGTSVVVNTMERVTIRATVQVSSRAAAASVTLTLRRGSPLVEARLSAYEADWGWSVVDASAGTSVTGGGIVATTADADGNKWLTTCPDDASKIVTGNSGWSLASDPTKVFTVGLGFLPAGFADTATNLVEQWFAAVSATVRAVSS